MEDKYTTPQQLQRLRRQLDAALAKEQARPNRRAGLRKALGWAAFGLCAAVLLAVLAIAVTAKVNGQTPTILGYQLYVVQSGSMKPTLDIGSLILSRVPGDAAQLQKGDIITFVDDGMTITHRIVSVESNASGILYHTKGDNPENAPDPDPVTVDRVKAVFVLRIPFT